MRNPSVAGLGFDLLEALSCGRRVGGGPVVEGGRERLLLDGPAGSRAKDADALAPFAGGRVELEPVLADVGQLGHTDDCACDLGGAPTDARDEPVAAGEASQLCAGRFGNARVGRVGHDRSQRAVDVEAERCSRRVGGEGGEGVHRRIIAYTSVV